jgi:hypothetical protein
MDKPWWFSPPGDKFSLEIKETFLDPLTTINDKALNKGAYQTIQLA